MDTIIGWALQSNFEYDVPCGAGLQLRPKSPIKTFKKEKIQYNQAKSDPYWCTRYGAMTCVANNRDVDRDDSDFQWFRKNAEKYWWKDKLGMYTSRAGDMVVDRLNYKFPKQNRVKESLYTYDNKEEIEELFNLWWMIHFSSNINKAYTDTIQDWVIEEPRGAGGIGHSRSKTKSSGSWNIMIENYVDWLPYNVIDIKDYEELLNKKQFHIQVFIYYPTTNMTEIPYPYMSIEEADLLEKKYPDLFTPNFSESVRAWIDASKAGVIEWKYKNYKGIDWVMKMMIDLWVIR